MEALRSFLANAVAHRGLRLIVLDDLDVRSSMYLDESVVGYDSDRVLRSFTVTDQANVAAAVDFITKAASFRTIALAVDLECSLQLTNGIDLSDEQLAELHAAASHVFVSAFDGEGFVVADHP